MQKLYYKTMVNESPKPTILVVDDTETNIDILVDALEDVYEVSVAMDGESALEIVESNPPDLILLDIMMPGMDGYEVCRQLKANDTTKNIPIIFLTAKAEVSDETKGLELGAEDYITKPISIPIVRARVKTHLSLLHARKNLEMQNDELREAAELREDIERITRHDLKTPLNAMISLPPLLMMEGNLTEDQQESVKMIQDSGYKMLRMINLSLDLFKMERGLYPFNPVEVDLLKLVRNIIAETEDIINSKELSVIISIEGKPLETNDTFIIQAEELLCYSMLANLITNALEASPEGETVSIAVDKKGASSIRILNQGVVPENIRNTFFDKYVTSGKISGTGLGTYSAKLIAETQKGSIGMETSEENGTTVTVGFSG